MYEFATAADIADDYTITINEEGGQFISERL